MHGKLSTLTLIKPAHPQPQLNSVAKGKKGAILFNQTYLLFSS
jgi:hypothetical protein